MFEPSLQKRDINVNGMEKKEMINGKIATCPKGMVQNWSCLEVRGLKNNATVNFIVEHSPSDLDRLLKSGPSFAVCFGTDRLLRPAEGRQVWGGTRCLLPEHENGAHIWTGKSHGTFYCHIQVSIKEAITKKPSRCLYNKRKKRAKLMPFHSSNPHFSNIYRVVQRGDSKFPLLTLQLSSFEGHLWNESLQTQKLTIEW